MRSYAFLLVILCACSSSPSTTSTSASSSGAGGASSSSTAGGASLDAGSDVEQPLPEIDAAPACLENGGITCVQDSDCPPAVGCAFCFRCVTLPDGTKGCRSFPRHSTECAGDAGAMAHPSVMR